MKVKDTICPVCEEYSFEYSDDNDICPICGWENDGLQREQKDYWGGANDVSVNEAKTVYSFLHDNTIKSKVTEIIDRYEERNSKIRSQFKGIDHRTVNGEECRNAYAQAHRDFIIELRKLSETQNRNYDVN